MRTVLTLVAACLLVVCSSASAQEKTDRETSLAGAWKKHLDNKGTATFRIQDNGISLVSEGEGIHASFKGEFIQKKDGVVYGVFTRFEYSNKGTELKLDELRPCAFRAKVEGDVLTIEGFACDLFDAKSRQNHRGRYKKSADK